MARKYELITELYHRIQAEVTTLQEWQRFLSTACRNYKLPFDEQLLLFAQRPDATAVLEIERWNRQFGRWVNRGATGIAVFDRNAPGRARLKYYFDISDTHPGRFARRVPLWQVRPEQESEITEALENSFGELEDKSSFAEGLLSAAKNAVEDNLPDYLSELKYYKEDSFLEELDDLNLEVTFRNAVRNSVGYMLLVRCGIDPSLYFTDDDFRRLTDFNTPQVLNALGVATGDIGQMCLSEISRTIMALERKASLDRTVAEFTKDAYPVTRNETKSQERSDIHDRTDIPDGERLPASESSAPAGAGGGDWEIRPAAPQVPAGAPQGDVHEHADQRAAEPAPAGDRAGSPKADGADHGADGESRGRDGAAESHRPDEVGGNDEQHPAESRGDRFERSDLQLSGHDFNTSSEIPYYHYDVEKQELLRISDALKDYRTTIAAYFAEHEDSRERGNFVRSFFDNTYVEKILKNGQRAGYRAYDDLLTLWRGSYLSREMETFLRWESVASVIYGMILTEQWLSPEERPLPMRNSFRSSRICRRIRKPPLRSRRQRLTMYLQEEAASPRENSESMSSFKRARVRRKI